MAEIRPSVGWNWFYIVLKWLQESAEAEADFGLQDRVGTLGLKQISLIFSVLSESYFSCSGSFNTKRN